VLLDSFEANFAFYQSLLIRAGYAPPTREEFRALFHLTMRDVIQIVTKASDDETHRIWEMGKSRTVKYPLELLTMPAHAAQTIRALKEKYKLAIVTSRISESVYEFHELKAVQECFAATVSYQDTTKHKPHPEPLLLAAQKLQVEPSEAVYIGDVKNDIKAARAAGMKVILYAPTKIGDPDAHASSFKQLLDIIPSL
jgi:HAD superfamily hydrolase (TIGR01509 family)